MDGNFEKCKNSILWLLKDNDYSEKNLKEFAKKENVDPNRIIFAKGCLLINALGLKFTDLFIDSFLIMLIPLVVMP